MQLNVKQTSREVQEQWSQWEQWRCFSRHYLMACDTSGSSPMVTQKLIRCFCSNSHMGKMDCVGHVQKTALRNLKVQCRGQKLADGKTIGGIGRLTDKVINSLQNYYGDAIRKNKGDVEAMMKAVQATLFLLNQ